MSNKIFWGKKIVLSSGREIDLSADKEKENTISILAIANHLDPLHEITKPISIRCEWNNKEEDPILSFECRGGAPRENRAVSESELPIEGLNGFNDKLRLSELNELFSKMLEIYKNIKI